MSDKKDQKKNNDEFTNFLLNDDTAAQKTVQLPKAPDPQEVAQDTAKISKKPQQNEKIEKSEKTKSILTSVKKEFEKKVDKQETFFSKDSVDASLFSLEAALKQAEYLRIAQAKVKQLEKKISDITTENETLVASTTVLQKKYEQVSQQLNGLKQDQKDQAGFFKDELAMKDKVVKVLEKEKEELKRRNEELETMMFEKVQQIRIREKELQNRLEILHQDGDALISNKDEMILDLKKQIDQLSFEIEGYKNQSRELNKEIQGQKDQIRRSIKALRLALNLLENEDLTTDELKKTGT